MKKIVSVIALFTCFLTFAQQEKLEVTYTSRMILPDDFSFQSRGDGRTMPKEMQEQFKKNIQEPQEAVLTILGDESVYKMVEKISNDQSQGSRGMRGGMRMMAMNGDNIYKNSTTHQTLKEQNIMGKSYVIKDSLQNYDWKLTRETKTILGNEAKKATTIIDSVQTTVWYIPTLKYKTGPENYWGLPGLILEVNDGKTVMLCTKIVMNSKEKVTINPVGKGKQVTQKEYDEIVKKKMEEMMEMNSGPNGQRSFRISR